MNKYDAPDDTGADDSAESRVLRGGAWGYDLDLARADFRLNFHPLNRLDYGGFRVVCASPIR